MRNISLGIVLTALFLNPSLGAQTTEPETPPVADEIASTLPDGAMEQARAFQAQERWVEAADLFLKITEAEPDNGPAWFHLGYSLHAAGELELALSAHRKAATFEQYTGVALYNLGCAHALLEQPDKAMEALQASFEAGYDIASPMESDPDLDSLRDDERFEALLTAAEESRGDDSPMAEGKRSLMAAVERGRKWLAEHGPALMEKASTMSQQAAGAVQQKYQELREMAEDDEQIAEIRAKLKGAFAKAHEAFMQWRESQNPGEAHDVVAMEEHPDEEDSAEAESVGDEAAEEYSLSALLNIADEHFDRGEFPEAAEAYASVVELDPEDGRAWFRLGYTLHVSGNLEPAIKAHKQAAEYDAFRGIALYNLACANSLLGNTDAAFEALELCREAGFDRLGGMDDDSDFDNIRDDERFEAFLDSLNDPDF